MTKESTRTKYMKTQERKKKRQEDVLGSFTTIGHKKFKPCLLSSPALDPFLSTKNRLSFFRISFFFKENKPFLSLFFFLDSLFQKEQTALSHSLSESTPLNRAKTTPFFLFFSQIFAPLFLSSPPLLFFLIHL